MTGTAVGGRGAAAGRTDRALVWLLAVACGVSAANLYYAQPLLGEMGADLGVTEGVAGTIVFVTQVGYAFGLVLLVPLGDLLPRRTLIPVLSVLAGLGCLGVSLAPNAPALLVFVSAMALASAVAQILVPLAADLAVADERGTVVGLVMTGLLIGILLARTLSGLVAEVAGWRTVFALAAGMMVTLAMVLAWRLPTLPAGARSSYRALLGSVLAIVRDEPVLRRRMLSGALVMACFTAFWTSFAFLAGGSPYAYSEATIGLFGLLGVAGALAAQRAGRFADRGWGVTAGIAFTLCILAGWGLSAIGGSVLVALIAGIVLMDLGIQGAHILNQSAIYALRPEARSRITTAYMTAYFAGGAAGSGLSTLAWGVGGWNAVCVVGAAIAAGSVLAIARERSTAARAGAAPAAPVQVTDAG